ncbi:MAG: trehalose-phosphatase [Syntrophobacteraceae bacterium]
MKHNPAKPQVIDSPDFWSRVCGAARPFLGLDYDGTLAPFHLERMQALPLPGVVELLESINEAGKTFLAIISGRPLSELLCLLGDLPIPLVGSHGFERKYPGSQMEVVNLPHEQATGLAVAGQTVEKLGLAHLTELKTASIALHTRPLQTNQAERIEALVLPLWTDIASCHNLHCRRFNGGIEILSQACNKADALITLFNRSGADLPIYIGDDATDEDAFRVLAGRGIGIRVGGPETPTAAEGFLPDCRAVKELLTTWLSIDSGHSC